MTKLLLTHFETSTAGDRLRFITVTGSWQVFSMPMARELIHPGAATNTQASGGRADDPTGKANLAV
jgi:hypothetical protein